jgi:Tfp pilus assembly protein PilF
MANIFKAFMYDLRTEGFVYAVKSTVREFNPYAQLRDARAWMEDMNGVIEALSDDVLQLEATIEQLEKRNARLEWEVTLQTKYFRRAVAQLPQGRVLDLYYDMSNDRG